MVCIISEEENKISKTVIYFTTPRSSKKEKKKKIEKENLNNFERQTETAHEQNFNQYKDKERSFRFGAAT